MRRRYPPCRPLPERLWAKIAGPWNDPTVAVDDCWLWTGGWRSRYGYGRIRAGRRGSRALQAHVVAFEIVVDPVPAGQWLRHRCDVPGCCNPWHLQLGTAAENY